MKDEQHYIRKQVSNYSIERQLSIGEFGRAYLGRHIVFTERPFIAIKLLQAHLASEEEKERFLQEDQYKDCNSVDEVELCN